MMEFVIQNIGWFVGIILVLLLALIGYFADKRERENVGFNKTNGVADNNVDNTNNVNSTSINNVDGVNDNLNASFSKYQDDMKQSNVDNSISQVSDVNYEHDNIDNIDNNLTLSNVTDSSNNNLNVDKVNDLSDTNVNVLSDINNEENVIDNQFRNIENVNMSLEDLEKKNYTELLNNRNGIEKNDIVDNQILEDGDLKLEVSDKNDFTSDVSIDEGIDNSQLVENSVIVSPNEEQQSDMNDVVEKEESLNDDLSVSSQVDKQSSFFDDNNELESIVDDSVNAFQSEEQFSGLNEIINDNQQNNAIDLNSSIPELVGNGFGDFDNVDDANTGIEESLNKEDSEYFYDDVADDDIWKF